jgi:hypothetical protein
MTGTGGPTSAAVRRAPRQWQCYHAGAVKVLLVGGL